MLSQMQPSLSAFSPYIGVVEWDVVPLGYHPELDVKTTLPKKLHAYVIEHGEITLLLTCKLHPYTNFHAVGDCCPHK